MSKHIVAVNNRQWEKIAPEIKKSTTPTNTKSTRAHKKIEQEPSIHSRKNTHAPAVARLPVRPKTAQPVNTDPVEFERLRVALIREEDNRKNLEATVSRLLKENTSLKSTQSSTTRVSKDVEAYQKSNKKLMAEIHTLKQSQKPDIGLEKKYKSTVDKFNELVDTHNSLKKSHDNTQRSLDALKSSHDNIKRSLDDAKRSHDNTKRSLDDIRKKHEATIDELKEQLHKACLALNMCIALEKNNNHMGEAAAITTTRDKIMEYL